MSSIRLSLTICFLALLALALAAAGLLAERTARRALEERRHATAQLIESQYKERTQADRKHRDDVLLSQAQAIARLTQVHFERTRFHREFHALGLMTSVLAPSGYLASATWGTQGWGTRGWGAPGVRGPFADLYRAGAPPSITLASSDLFHDDDETLLFQIDGWGSSYHSASLGKRQFPRDSAPFAPDQLVYWDWDDTHLVSDTPGGQVPVRRVRLKASAVRMVTGDRGRDAPRREFLAGPTILVQVGYDLNKRDTALAAFDIEREQELARLDTETDDALAWLRRALVVVAAFVFAAAVGGCYGLVRLGLAPLERLSEAVSQVSPRDFRLPLDNERIPRELVPIVERLTATLEQLRRAFAREKQATADLSHELRTPLAAVLAATELALRKTRSAEEYREFLAECRRGVQHVHAIAERLLDLARLDAGVAVLRPALVDAVALAEQTAAVVRPLAQAHGIELRVHPPDESGQIFLVADPDKFREVLMNLLHNAVQYNRPAGEDGGGTIDVTFARDECDVIISVHDTGVGIPEGMREQIFERFYRGDPSRSGDGLHAGLGLALVKEYVQRMGGSVSVDSALGKGSTFCVRLPAKDTGSTQMAE